MIHLNFKYLRSRTQLSEEAVAGKAGLSRLTVRQLEAGQGNPTLDSLNKLAQTVGAEMYLLLAPNETELNTNHTTVGTSLRILQDGFDSWPIHLMEMVDEFRKTVDIRLLLLPPVPQLEPKLKALLASTAIALCEEVSLTPPAWANGNFFLSHPWFLSETESLKAMAIRDSPLAFRKNNIFVLDNFLQRA